MKVACLFVLGIVLSSGWAASAQGVVGGDSASTQDPYKGPMGTEEHPVRVSAGVMAGLLLHKVDPEHPGDLKEVTGAVVMSAKVDKTGKVVELKVISGPALLRNASIDAVRQWTYKPYLLNGQPVFVQTTIAVNFNWR